MESWFSGHHPDHTKRTLIVIIRFYSIYPLELEGRITPTQWLDTVNGINEILISAHSLRRAALHHILSFLTLYIASMIIDSHYEKVDSPYLVTIA